MDELLSFPYIKFLHPVQQIERVIAFVTDFASVDFLDSVDVVFRKKLLRFFAGRSAGSVIAPVNLQHFLSPLQSLDNIYRSHFCRPRLNKNPDSDWKIWVRLYAPANNHSVVREAALCRQG